MKQFAGIFIGLHQKLMSFFFFSVGDQALAHPRQVLYHWAAPPTQSWHLDDSRITIHEHVLFLHLFSYSLMCFIRVLPHFDLLHILLYLCLSTSLGRECYFKLQWYLISNSTFFWAGTLKLTFRCPITLLLVVFWSYTEGPNINKRNTSLPNCLPQREC
jgi:hypothetical protein